MPPPANFAEGQRKLFGILAAGAGMFCGAMAIGMIALLMWGGWSPQEEHTIVVIFGWTLGGYVLSMLAVIIGLMVGGPVGRFKASVGKDGGTFEADSGGESTTTTTTTATATVSTPAPPGDKAP